jgi:hypothetical protein
MVERKVLPMSRSKFRNMTIFCIAVAVLCAVLNISYCTGGFFIAAAFFGLIYAALKLRDYQTVKTADTKAAQPPTRQAELPPMTSKGSSRLFVPPTRSERH